MHSTFPAGTPAAEAFRSALMAIDQAAIPSAPVVRDLRSAIRPLIDGAVDSATAGDLRTLLIPVHLALDAVGAATLRLPSVQLLELAASIDEALYSLESPDLSRVPVTELPERFSELFSAIVRLRSAYQRLRAQWERREITSRRGDERSDPL